jgi:hypothetical protein
MRIHDLQRRERGGRSIQGSAVGVGIVATFFSNIGNPEAMSYSINLGVLTWLGAVVWLAYRVIRRLLS